MCDMRQCYLCPGSQDLYIPRRLRRRLHDGVFGPKQPDGIKRGNWIQTMSGVAHNNRDARMRQPALEGRTQVR